MSQANVIRSYIAPRKVAAMHGFDAAQYQSLSKIGIDITSRDVAKLHRAHSEYAMDALQPTITQASMATPVQFLQEWLPGTVYTVTAARKIDDLIGIATMGRWEDEQVVQAVLERTGSAQPYGDYTNTPLSSWNTTFPYRTVVRFEEGLQVGTLESDRAAAMRIDDSGMKREAAADSLEITRNQIGFVGFNLGLNNTYGFLNDPGLLAYTTVATNAAGTSTQWANKSFLEITNDIITAVSTLRTQSQDIVDPERVDMTLAVATDAVDRLSTVSVQGISVRSWMAGAYPRIRVVSAPQLNNANGSANVFYLYAERIQDMSTDGGAVFLQCVPTKMKVLGVQQLAKGYIESYSNATAGVMVKRPFANVRFTGI